MLIKKNIHIEEIQDYFSLCRKTQKIRSTQKIRKTTKIRETRNAQKIERLEKLAKHTFFFFFCILQISDLSLYFSFKFIHTDTILKFPNFET